MLLPHAFDRLAPAYDRLLAFVLGGHGGHARFRDRLAALLLEELPGDARLVVDAGCGTLASLEALDRAAGGRFHLLGLDPSGEMLRVGRGKPFGTPPFLVRAMAHAIPLASGSAQGAILAFVLHEVPPGLRQRSLEELIRVLGPGGLLLLVELAPPRRGAGRFLTPLLRLVEGGEALAFLRGLGEWLSRFPLREISRHAWYGGLVEARLLRVGGEAR
jgi:ubiquinone/menaquinone biosynthesis C-methylase UbiE